MAAQRLPNPGSDDGTWGDILNGFLEVEHNPDGTLNPSGSLATKANTSSLAAVATSGNYTDLTNKPIIPTDATTGAKGIVQLSGDLAGTASAPTVAKVNGVAVSGTPSANQVLTTSSSTAASWGGVPSSYTVINVKDAAYGAKGDGTTDDSAAIQAAITAANAAGGGIVYLPPGSYALKGNGAGTSGALKALNNVAIEGAGIGVTILLPFATVAAFSQTYSTIAPLTLFSMSHLTIDGANQSGTYNLAIKGVFLAYLAQCTFEDLVIQNTIATGLGIDYLTQGTVIHAVRVINCGRGNPGGTNGAGGNGIGIGTGQFTVESASISDCYARSSGRDGIMLESQNGSHPVGYRITNCWAEASGNNGFTDSGGSGAVWSSCVAYNNTSSAGFSIDGGTINAVPGDRAIFIGCVSYNNNYGFAYFGNSSTTGAGRLAFKNCKAWANSAGIYMVPLTGTTIDEIDVVGCEFEANKGPGIFHNGAGTIANLSIASTKLRGNATTSGSNKSGIKLSGPVTNLFVQGCRAWDDNGTPKQTYGLEIASGVTVTTGLVANNDFRGNATGSFLNSGTIGSGLVLKDNAGYNPVGAATVSVTASPMTYTAGNTPEVLYINGGTVSAVAKGATTIAAASPTIVNLNSGEAVTVTYSAAPTMATDKR